MSSTTTALTISNMALRILGVARITIINTSTEQGSILNDIYDDILDECICAHPWNFAMKRANLTQLGGEITDWTEGASDVWSAALTTEPASVEFDGSEGTEVASAALCVAAKDWFWESNILYVYSTSDPEDAYTSSGVFAVIPEFQYSYAFQIPSDSLRIVKMEDDESDFVRENNQILTDESECKIQYIARITDQTKYTPAFITTFAARLAAEMAFPLTDSPKIAETTYKLYLEKLRVAKSMDAQEGSGQEIKDLSWEDART